MSKNESILTPPPLDDRSLWTMLQIFCTKDLCIRWGWTNQAWCNNIGKLYHRNYSKLLKSCISWVKILRWLLVFHSVHFEMVLWLGGPKTSTKTTKTTNSVCSSGVLVWRGSLVEWLLLIGHKQRCPQIGL